MTTNKLNKLGNSNIIKKVIDNDNITDDKTIRKRK